MRTEKNQNNQLPAQVAAETVVTYCHLEGKEQKVCNHKGCYLLTHKSKYYQSIKVWFERYEFTHFDVSFSDYDDKVFLMPHNPFPKGDKNWNNFEIYRQAMNSVIKGKGDWPKGLKKVSKADVSIKNIEYKHYLSVWHPKDINSETPFEMDIKEYAFYNPNQKGGRQDG